MGQKGFYEEFHSFYYYSGSTQNWKMKGFHIHKEYELLLFMSGGATVWIGSRVYRARPGDLFLINNREYHKTEGAEGEAYGRYVLMFDPDWVLGLEPAMGYRFSRLFEDREEGGGRLHLSGDNLEQVVRQMERIESCSRRRGDEAGAVLLKLCILELLVKLGDIRDALETKGNWEQGDGSGWEDEGGNWAAEDNGGRAAPDRERIEQIKVYVREHVDERLDLEDIARRFYISSHYLSHYFRRETGFTLGQFIAQAKIDRAKELLRRGFSVTDTAISLSYNSDSHFINTFKRLTGTTPKRYASEMRK